METNAILRAMDQAFRISALESKLGAELPQDYRRFLASHKTTHRFRDQVVTSNADYWGVRCVFELADGAQGVQVDNVFRLVGDALLSGMIPVAEDEGGNLYLLDCAAHPGTVYWWNHEREAADERMAEVASTFSGFIQLLEPSSS